MDPLKISWGAPRGHGNTRASEKDLADMLDIDGMVSFAQEAASLGVEGILMAIGFHLPNPVPLIGALARETKRIEYILAYRPGLLHPTLFTQVVNTLSWISGNRVSLC
jgi:alkanesulfonate monooxygenase